MVPRAPESPLMKAIPARPLIKAINDCKFGVERRKIEAFCLTPSGYVEGKVSVAAHRASYQVASRATRLNQKAVHLRARNGGTDQRYHFHNVVSTHSVTPRGDRVVGGPTKNARETADLRSVRRRLVGQGQHVYFYERADIAEFDGGSPRGRVVWVPDFPLHARVGG
jgi:hypothetical protein